MSDLYLPEIETYIKHLNNYLQEHYPANKKISAEEWNALFLALIHQGNLQEKSLEKIYNEILPKHVLKINKLISDSNNLNENNHKIEYIDTLPEASAELVGKYYYYTGEDDNINRIQGNALYKCVRHTDENYYWVCLENELKYITNATTLRNSGDIIQYIGETDNAHQYFQYAYYKLKDGELETDFPNMWILDESFVNSKDFNSWENAVNWLRIGKVDTTTTINGKPLSDNITLNANDVNALPDTTKYGATISLTIDSSTYKITTQLKDQNGDNLGTAQIIDLPLESVVVNGRYNTVTKEVILTLQNGSTISFSVADLVSGLQSELTENNKLNVDLINGISTIGKTGNLSDAIEDTNHRTVTDTEKTTWNNKVDKDYVDNSTKVKIEYIDTLPEASQEFVNRYFYYTGEDDYEAQIQSNSLYKCVFHTDGNYYWVCLENELKFFSKATTLRNPYDIVQLVSNYAEPDDSYSEGYEFLRYYILMPNATNDKYFPNLWVSFSENRIIIDTEMSATSENAVQNKVIKNYVDNAISSAIGNVSSLLGDTADLEV